MKSILKNILAGVLGWQVRQFRKKNNFKIIGVVGSIGKTSTKLAIAQVLEGNIKTRYQKGNYNDIVSVPLVFFGQEMPSLWNIFSWLKIIFQNEIQIYSRYPFDVVVVELGTDAPGQISQFRKYLHLNVAVLTAVTPEHMEFFSSIENVAEEEWSVSFFSDIVFANKDLCRVVPENIDHRKIVFYGMDFGSAYKIENVLRTKNGFSFDISHKGERIIKVSHNAFSEVQLYSIDAAVALAKKFKISNEGIEKALGGIKSFAGRMQKIRGIKNSLIIDDTYNASPEAVKLALNSLYAQPATQRIAILGMMNELGDTSKEEHEKIGKHCNSKFLDLVVTVGKDANLFLASTARGNGCEVYEAKNSVDAGNFVAGKILPAQAGKEGAVVLAKGSQNGVFVEEALKPLLKDQSDISKLVRQDKYWMNKKHLTF
ncbi:MAG: Mur ligase family protein [Candidatus Zambryskibacteria bacterium]